MTAETGQFGLTAFIARRLVASPLRLTLFLMVIFLLSSTVGGVLLLKEGIESALAKAEWRLGADLMVVPRGADVPLQKGLFGGVPTTFSLPANLEREVPGVSEVSISAPQYFLKSAQASCCEAGNLFLVGFDPDHDFVVAPWAKEILRRPLKGTEIVVGGAIMKAPGASFQFYGETFTVAARLEKTGLGFFDNSVFIPLAGVAAMERSSRKPGNASLTVPWGRPSMLLIKIAPNATAEDVAPRIQRLSPEVQLLSSPQIFKESRLRITRLKSMLLPVTVAALLLAGSLAAAAQLLFREGHAETGGLLLALGRSRVFISLVLAGESLVPVFCGTVAGFLTACSVLRLFTPYITVHLGHPFILKPEMVGSAFLFVTASLLAASSLPAFLILGRILRADPYDLLRSSR